MVELGVFLPVTNNGYIVSTAAPQYQPSYAMNRAVTRLAEDLGFHFVRDQEKVLRDEVERYYASLTSIVQNQVAPANAGGFRRVGIAQNDRLVIFSDHYMTHRGHRNDYFFKFN